MTLFALTNARTSECGVAGAPVTHWKFYDRWHRRYMSTPQDNPAGFETPPPFPREDLRAPLLIITARPTTTFTAEHADLVDALAKAANPTSFTFSPRASRFPRQDRDRFPQRRRGELFEEHLDDRKKKRGPE